MKDQRLKDLDAQTAQHFRLTSRGLDHVLDAVLIVDEGGVIVFANVQAELLFGYTREQLVGEPIEKLVPKRFHAKHVGDRDLYIEEPRPRVMGERTAQVVALKRSGKEVPVEIALRPVPDVDGTFVYVIVRRRTVVPDQPALDILYVDDDPGARRLMVMACGAAELSIVAVERPSEIARTIAALSNPRLILLDVMMPGVDGLEACRNLKADPTTHRIPVVLYSALPADKLAQDGYDTGAHEVIEKSLPIEQVVARLKELLAVYEARP